MDIWQTIKDNLDFIIPIALPAAFLIFDVFIKAVLGETDFNKLGADASLGGWSLFTGTMLGQIQNKRMTDGSDILTAFLFFLLFLALWWVCLSLSFKKFPAWAGNSYQPTISFFIGSLVFYFCSASAFSIMK